MPDIAMCTGVRNGNQSCPRCGSCYRYTAKPTSFRQSYFATPPFKDDGECDYYWPNDTAAQERKP